MDSRIFHMIGKLFIEGWVLLLPLHYMNPSKESWERTGTSAQLEELRLQALATLVTVAPLLIDDYVTCQGNTPLLLLLEWCAKQDAYFGQDHSFHGNGGRGNKKAQMRYCVRLLRAMTSLGEEGVNQDLCDQGAISQLLGIIMQMERSNEKEDAVVLEIKTDILLTLSMLCENDLHRKELFGSDGVEMTVKFLKMSPAKFYSGLGHNKLIFATVDCIWSCIVGCYTTEDLFLEKEGIFLLLDLLHSSQRSMHSLVLGTLLELLDNPKALPHLGTWRGRGGQTAAGLLVRLWREEERELGVRRDPHGRITDTKKPILSSYQEVEPVEPLPVDLPSAAVIDVSDNSRSKIYCILCKLGFEDLPGLTTEDYVTLVIISRYFDFKVGEVWEEITRELEAEGVRPVSPDREALDTIAQVTEDKAKMAAAQQDEILEQKQQQDILEEQRMYSEICSHHKQQELTAKSWELFVARTSNHNTLVESKKVQEKSIEASKPKIKHEESVFHTTQIAGLNVTNFSGRVMRVESTPLHLIGGAQTNPEQVHERKHRRRTESNRQALQLAKARRP